MATPIIMPRQGQSVESCIISEWFVKKGDKVKEGDRLFAYETDKAAFEEESKVEGTVLEIFFQEGEDVPVLTNICAIGTEGEDFSQFSPSGSAQEPEQTKEEPTAEEKEDAVEEQAVPEPAINPDNVFISPRARNLAEKTGADIRFAEPTGPNGRIIERDVRKLQTEGHLVTPAAKGEYAKVDQSVSGTGLGGRITTKDISKPVENIPVSHATETQTDEAKYVDVKLSNIRKVIARSMHESLSQMAQLTLNASFDATDILQYRKRIKSNIDAMGLSNITINDILIFAASRVLLMHKDLNAHFLGDSMRYFSCVHMGVATDTDRGLMVPTLFHAEQKSLNDISAGTKELIQACRKGTISPDMLRDGTFTITNLGTLGIESFTPVINPPQTAILGVNTIQQKFREKDGKMESYSSMSLSLTFDHRAVDGAPAARFLKDLKNYLENFTVLLAKG